MTHLHVHSAHSLVDGRASVDDYVALAEKDGQHSLALTEHGSLGSVISAYQTCRKHGINFIAGQEMYVDSFELGSPANKNQFGYGHLTVLAKNEAGYRALIAANNLAHRQFYQKPRLTLKQIIDNKFAQDWIILSGCMSSPIFQHSYAEAENMVKVLQQNCGNFFLEVMWHQSNDEQFNVKQDSYLERIAALHKSTRIPLALTNDCHYAYEHQETIHSELLKSSHSPSELEFDGEGFHFLTLKQMQIIADGLGCKDALDNSVEIGKMCNLVIPEAEHTNWYVPDITGGKPEAVIESLCTTELWTMMQHGYGQEYEDRYNYEMSVLRTSPAILNSYLVTYDVVSWCRDRGYTVAARGSMAGSLVSYLLGITTEDPVKYNLSFSRAVNPARPSIPDFDLDVSSIHRQEVLDYLKQRYVGNIPICSYTHYGPKGALRKILRMEGLRDQQNINDLCKLLPDDWSGGDFEYSVTSKKYIGNTPWFENIPPQYRNFVSLYQGLYSSLSVHPSGVLISGPERELEHEVPLQWIASSKTLASAYDMYTLKKIGLFKLDVLGLKTLDQLEYMERMSGEKIPNDNYDEPEVLAAFGADLLAEIFQMDGYACREVIKSIGGINNFEDIIAANTLARPGASEFTRWYRSGYEGLLGEYPTLRETLGPTNGLILYQEQVMEIAKVLADFDDAEQDDVKEAIKYFRHEIWEGTIEPLFRARCLAKGINPENMLKAISKMASYTYNKCISGDTVLNDGRTIKEWFVNPGKTLKSLDKNNHLIENNVISVYESGIKPLIEIGWENGFLKCTREHKIWTVNRGWVLAGDLKLGDVVYGNAKRIQNVSGNPSQDVGFSNSASSGDDSRRTQRNVWQARSNLNRRSKEENICKETSLVGFQRRRISSGIWAEDFRITNSGRPRKYSSSQNTVACRQSRSRYRTNETNPQTASWNVDKCSQCYTREIPYRSGISSAIHSSSNSAFPGSSRIPQLGKNWLRRMRSLLSEPVRNRSSQLAMGNGTYQPEEDTWPTGILRRDYSGDIYRTGWNEQRQRILPREISGYSISANTEEGMGYFPILWINDAGYGETYDIEMSSPCNNFLANGIIVHNSHAMTYAAIAYKMMYFKIHHPAIYYAATFDSSDDKPRLVLESHFFGVKWHPADVNKSEAFTTVKDGEILLGLAAIKGVGPAAVEELFKSRPFTSVEDLETRVEKRKCNSKVRSALQEAFAFESLGIPGTFTRFEECFGFNYKFLDSATSKKLSDWQSEYSIGRLAGFVVSLREITIQKAGPNQGKLMGRMKVVNINGSKDAIIWPDRWKKARGVLYSGCAIRAEGEYQLDGSFILAAGELYDD